MKGLGEREDQERDDGAEDREVVNGDEGVCAIADPADGGECSCPP